jgi:hypothetical protein
VEFDIVELNCLVLRCPALGFVVGLVVEPQLEIRHARELAVRVNHPNDFALDDVVGRTDEHGQLLNNIQKELILGVFDTFLPPRDYIGDLPSCIDGASKLRLFGEGVGKFIRFCFNESFEEFDLGGLRVAIVHHLVKQLVNNDEVVADGLLLDVLEVAFEDVDQRVKKREDKDGIIIFFGDGDEIEIVMLVKIEEVVVLVLDEGPRWRELYLRVYSSYSRIFLLKTS